MGEYAIRKKDRAEIKIGSCESMYYCRYEQLDEIEYKHSTENCLWRIPVPCEDGIEPGDFNYQLKTERGDTYCQLRLDPLKIPDREELAKCTGITQVRVEALGLLVNVECRHGIELPESTKSAKFFWNGKREPLHLYALKNTKKHLLVVYKCDACGTCWSCEFSEIEPAIEDIEMKLRIYHQVCEYFIKHNEGYGYGYNVMADCRRGGKVTIMQVAENEYAVYNDDEDTPISYGTWEEMRNQFIKELSDEQGAYLKRKYLFTENK